MNKILITGCLLIINLNLFGWGQTGHRVIGKIAEEHLSRRARKNIEHILGNETIAMASTFMDEIRSDEKYRFLDPWHYCTIPDGGTYEQAGSPEEGDVIQAIRKITDELKSSQFTMEDEAFNLKLLIHLVGDIHQPLHVGNGEDRGGNDVRVEYFWRSSNLHRVWDSGIIDGEKLSYTEYAEWIHHPEADQIDKWQSDSILDWAYESVSCRDQVYDIPENGKINYQYDYKNIDLVNQRLLQAGIRLAGLLNEIYG